MRSSSLCNCYVPSELAAALGPQKTSQIRTGEGNIEWVRSLHFFGGVLGIVVVALLVFDFASAAESLKVLEIRLRALSDAKDITPYSRL